MNDDRYKKIYDLALELQNKCYKTEYEELLKSDNNIGTFEDYILSATTKNNLKRNKKNKRKNYILKDQFVKDNIMINMYMIKFKHIEPVELDEDYKPLPLQEKNIFQYGTIITMQIAEGYITIDDVFSDYKTKEELAKKEYEKLKKHLLNLSKDELLNEMEESIKNALNL